jgi:hypothetical protein
MQIANTDHIRSLDNIHSWEDVTHSWVEENAFIHEEADCKGGEEIIVTHDGYLIGDPWRFHKVQFGVPQTGEIWNGGLCRVTKLVTERAVVSRECYTSALDHRDEGHSPVHFNPALVAWLHRASQPMTWVDA